MFHVSNDMNFSRFSHEYIYTQVYYYLYKIKSCKKLLNYRADVNKSWILKEPETITKIFTKVRKIKTCFRHVI